MSSPAAQAILALKKQLSTAVTANRTEVPPAHASRDSHPATRTSASGQSGLEIRDVELHRPAERDCSGCERDGRRRGRPGVVPPASHCWAGSQRRCTLGIERWDGMRSKPSEWVHPQAGHPRPGRARRGSTRIREATATAESALSFDLVRLDCTVEQDRKSVV